MRTLSSELSRITGIPQLEKKQVLFQQEAAIQYFLEVAEKKELARSCKSHKCKMSSRKEKNGIMSNITKNVLDKKDSAQFKIFKHLYDASSNNARLTQKDIISSLALPASTIAYWMSIFRKVLGDSVIKKYREGKIIYWGIINPNQFTSIEQAFNVYLSKITPINHQKIHQANNLKKSLVASTSRIQGNIQIQDLFEMVKLLSNINITITIKFDKS